MKKYLLSIPASLTGSFFELTGKPENEWMVDCDPAYAPVGKILTPVPVFRWQHGQRPDQTLLDIQTPLYDLIMQRWQGNKVKDRLLFFSGGFSIFVTFLNSSLYGKTL